MCGIAGLLDLTGQRPVDRARLRRMTDAIRHRGPDGGGEDVLPGVGLGHRRLSIIDVEGGAQPIGNEDGTVLTTYNGEVYNYQDRIAELVAAGHRFRTRCDTEVLVHGYEEWGAEGLLARLNGMFAFAIWDTRREELLLARDRLGEKPLYYTQTADGWLLFASELPALLAGMDGTPPLDPQAVADYFAYGYVPDPRSIHRGVFKLPAGHYLSVRRGQALPAATRYWRPQFRDEHRGDDTALAEELLRRFRRAVEMRLVSEVPIGAFLSGGVDSSGVVALMAQATAGPVTTCSIGFGDPALDETGYARQVAQLYRTNHHEQRVDLDAAALVGPVAAAYGEPFADSSALPTYVVSQVARRHVTVALTGDGGDEVFAGYRRYPLHRAEERVKALLPAALRRAVFGPLSRIYPQLDRAPRPLRFKATFAALAADRAHGFLRAVTALPTADAEGLFTAAFQRETGGYDPAELLARHAADADSDDPLAVAQYMDLMTWLPGRMLVKTDRASMAHALELRAPLLDHELVDWAAGLPAAAKLRGMSGKVILKRALEPLVPRELLYRPKQGFVMPMSDWLRTALRPQLDAACARDGALAATGWFEPAALRRLAEDHAGGRRNHTPALWALMMFDAFLRRAQGDAPVLPEPAAADGA
jgi:asparagine synthase (glutamine-hydrolysing)